MQFIHLARHAMGSRFEIVLAGQTDPARLRAAGEEALAEIDRIEAQLSVYRPGSEITQINALADRMPVRVTPEVLSFLKHASELHRISGGKFDITVAPLVKAWGFMDGTPRQPSQSELKELSRCVGMHHVLLDESNRTVRFDAAGTMIELGAIGKGYAIEKAVELLRDSGIESALIHGGTSTVYAIGAPPGEEGWKIALEDPIAGKAEAEADSGKSPMRRMKSAAVKSDGSRAGSKGLFHIVLKDSALSVSSPAGKFFENQGKLFGHVIDPTEGGPIEGNLLAAVGLPSATETDALSTALLILGQPGYARLKTERPEIRTWLVDANARVLVDGLDVSDRV